MKRLILALPVALFLALASCDSDSDETPSPGGSGGTGGTMGRAGGGSGGSAGVPGGGAGGSGGGAMGGSTGGAGGVGGSTGEAGSTGSAGTSGDAGAGGTAGDGGGEGGTTGAAGSIGAGGSAGATGGTGGAGGTSGTGGTGGKAGSGGGGGTGGTSGSAGTGGAGGTGGTSGSAGSAGSGGGSTNNGFPEHWPDGVSCAKEASVTVWAYDDDTYILRQSLCSNFEGPFLYLLFGEDKVFLQDTGTGHVNVANVVKGVIAEWLAKKGKPSIDLVVTHSHSHGDHVGGDSQFNGQPNTTVVGTSVTAVQNFFGITNWPTQIANFELGGRTLNVIPIPGHQNAHVAVYDKSRELLLTGDTLYPGRLYVSNWSAYGQSLQRLVDFTAAPGHPVTWVLGTHIEMTTTPGQDYPMGANKHPNEHVLQLTQGTLLELNNAVKALGPTPQYQEHDDFIIFPL